MADSRELIRNMMVAVSNCAMYGREHSTVQDLSHRILEMVTEAAEQWETGFDMKIIEGDIVINGKQVVDPGVHGKGLCDRLGRRGITQIKISAGCTVAEIKSFLVGIASREGSMEALPHIAVGKVAIDLDGVALEGIGEGDVDDFRVEQIDKLREVYDSLSPFRELNVSGIEDIVMNFIVAFKKQADILSLISPVRSYSEYTYTHATNVSILSMYQAESLGFGSDLVHDIGIGALLHDAGKLFISNDILNKNGKLDDREWEEIRCHPVYGARYLGKIQRLPSLASILAFEHHLRYDGKGYPTLRMGRGTQSFCSQIVGLADFYDALRSRRPYKREWEPSEILALMKKNAGREFNPVLVDNFIRLMTPGSTVQ